LELLAELRAEGRRALVFSQFAELLRLVRPMIEAEGARVCMLTGSTAAAARRDEVDRFQRGEADVFLISLKAGGTGLNLTAASEVVLIDPWWNPAVEDQAADRAHRIGQTHAVTIYRLVARETLEDSILQLHDRKRDVAGAVLDGTGSAGVIPVEELLSLLQSATRP
jgi:SNF2 family DNA or RNA helicase